MANYYDRVLEGFDEGILDDSYDEGILDDAYDEGIFNKDRRRPLRVPGSIGKSSDFGRKIPSSSPSASPSGNYATKAELKSSLNSISEQVNDLKKSSLTIASSVKRLDDGYERVIKSIAKKDKSQDSVMGNSTMMTIIGALINKPTLNPSALTIVRGTAASPGTPRGTDDDGNSIPGTPPTPGTPDTIVATPDAIQVDLSKTLLFAMMPSMMAGSGSGSDNNSMMMMMMVLLLGAGNSGSTSGNSLLGSGSGSNSNNNLLLIMMMMMMMNKK